MQCVILAGGMGAKMQAITKKLPKSLIPIRNRPFLHYQLSHLAGLGIHNILLCVGYGGDQIERYAEDGRAWGLTIQYVKEGKQLHGTGGALRQAYEQGRLEPVFFVLSGDAYLPINFLPAWHTFESRTEPALMIVRKAAEKSGKGYILFDGQKIKRYEKKRPEIDAPYIGCGLSLMRPDAVEQGIPPKSVYALEDLFHKLSERDKLAGFEINENIYSLDSPEGFEMFMAYASQAAL